MSSRDEIQCRMALLLIVFLLLDPRALSQDPRKSEVPLPASNGWEAALVYESDVGIWTVKSLQLMPRFGCPEVIGLDDRGRCTILVSYSGKWTPYQTVEDGAWLGAIRHVDLDPWRDGPELYVGGKLGNLYQIQPRRTGGFDAVIIAHFKGRELHTFVAGDLLPSRRGQELLVFTRSGHTFLVFPPQIRGGPFEVKELERMPGRVRDAVLVSPVAAGQPPRILVAMRAREVALLQLTQAGLERRTLLLEDMGFGRIARRKPAAGKPEVAYVTRDDGVIIRLEESGEQWKREVIYAGPQGPRGVVSGRFHEDPDTETVAVFGYSKKVQILSRTAASRWRAETIFVDRDKGHWLAAAEVDGRNATDEIIGSGYGKRIFLLKRPPGYGLQGIPTDPGKGTNVDEPRPPRVAVRAGNEAVASLSPLSYGGGFETKSLIYETLVKRDAKGRIVPGLASSWKVLDDGRTLILDLREGARFHDGTAVDAESVRMHFKRWVGLPEHAWLGASRRVSSVEALSASRIRIRMDRPYAVLADLCAFNPCAVQGPGSRDRQGAFRHPVGSGPFRFGEAREAGRVLRYLGTEKEGKPVDLVRFEDTDSAPVEALLDGDLDAVVGGWLERIPRAELPKLQGDDRFAVTASPGSSVYYLSFSMNGATSSVALRQSVAAIIDRKALIRSVENGHADPCKTWAAPSVSVWPRSAERNSRPLSASTQHRPLVMLASAKPGTLHDTAHSVARQLRRAGLPVRVMVKGDDAFEQALAQGGYDLRIERTWGVPYDPFISLCARFLPPPESPSAATVRNYGVDPRLARLVDEATREVHQHGRSAVYERIQNLMDEEALIVPLFAPRRYAVVRKGCGSIRLDHDLYRMDLSRLRALH